MYKKCPYSVLKNKDFINDYICVFIKILENSDFFYFWGCFIYLQVNRHPFFLFLKIYTGGLFHSLLSFSALFFCLFVILTVLFLFFISFFFFFWGALIDLCTNKVTRRVADLVLCDTVTGYLSSPLAPK